MTIVTLVSGCGNAYPGDDTRDGGGQGGRWVSSTPAAAGEPHRLVADVTVGVIANPMSVRDIRRLAASASVFPNAEKASMLVGLTSTDTFGVFAAVLRESRRRAEAGAPGRSSAPAG